MSYFLHSSTSRSQFTFTKLVFTVSAVCAKMSWGNWREGVDVDVNAARKRSLVLRRSLKSLRDIFSMSVAVVTSGI